MAALFLTGELIGRAGIVDRSYLPPASVVVARSIGLAGDTGFLGNVLITVEAWALGLGIALGIGVPLGLLLGGVPVVNAAVHTVVEFLRPIPPVALIPLVLLLLGSGLEMKLALIVYSAAWPILFNTVYGLRDMDPLPRETLRAFGFGRLGVLWHVSLPAAAPFIATGVRLAASVALTIAVSAEIISGFGDGLGMFIAQAGTAPDGAADVLAATVWAGALGFLGNALLVHAERRMFRWHHARGGRA